VVNLRLVLLRRIAVKLFFAAGAVGRRLVAGDGEADPDPSRAGVIVIAVGGERTGVCVIRRGLGG
jgi:hypothetical protein